MDIVLFIIIALFSYFLGNVHFARIISSLKKDDITKHGSGNPGTMNMVRTHGFLLGLLTLILDAIKGAVPALLGIILFSKGSIVGYSVPSNVWQAYVFGLLSVIGHIFPLIYKFKGGKGVATAFGFFTVISPLPSLILFGAVVVIWFILKIGSLSSLIYMLSFAIWNTIVLSSFDNSIWTILITWITAILVYYAHRQNIIRLLKGKESKFSFKSTIDKDKTMIKSKISQIKNEKTTV